MQAGLLAYPRNWLQQKRATLRERLRTWATRRRGPEASPVTLHRRRIYIIPTKLGAAFSILLFCMLLGAMNYSNSMAFALTFLLTGVVLVSMHHTHRNLLNLTISAAHTDPVYAGQALQFKMTLHNPTRHSKIALGMNWIDQDVHDFIDLASDEHRIVTLPSPSGQRGYQRPERMTFHTRYPLGLFYAWNYVELDTSGLVYPSPEQGRSEPPPAAGEGRDRHQGLRGQEDYAGLRPYQRRDPPRLIHWKAYPRNRQLVVKQFADPIADSLWLDWDSLQGLELEARISRLCRWVLDAHRAGRSYGLRLPRQSFEPACDEGHKHRCLEALALLER
ncbi:MAG: DUF58 domain-containing protein [Nevskiales bacterium]